MEIFSERVDRVHGVILRGQEQKGRNSGREVRWRSLAVDGNVASAGPFHDSGGQARNLEGARGGKEPAESKEGVNGESMKDDEAFHPGLGRAGKG